MKDEDRQELILLQIQKEDIRKKIEEILNKSSKEVDKCNEEDRELSEKIWEIFVKTDEYKTLEPLIKLDEWYKDVEIKFPLRCNGPTNFDLKLSDGEIIFVSATHDYEGCKYTFKELCALLYKKSKEHSDFYENQVALLAKEAKDAKRFMEMFEEKK